MASVKDMSDFGFTVDSCKRISSQDYQKLRNNDCIPIKDDVLIAKDGSYLKHVFVWKMAIDLAILSSIAILRPNKKRIVPAFLAKYLMAPIVKKAMSGYVTGAALPRIILKDFKRFNISIPPIPIQQKIASILSAYDDLIENNTQRIKRLEEMAQRIYREWFVKFKFPGHENVKMVESELGMIPEGWEVKKLMDFGKIITGKTPSKKVQEYYGNEIPFIKTPDMHGNMFCISSNESLSNLGAESQKKKTLPNNTLCVSCIGTTGVVSIITTPSQTNQQINSIVLYEKDIREYLYFSLIDLKDTIKLYGAAGATMINLSKGKFELLKVVYPSDDQLLLEFHKIVSPIFDKIKTLQYINSNLRQTRDMLLPKLISGKIDMSDMDIAIGETS